MAKKKAATKALSNDPRAIEKRKKRTEAAAAKAQALKESEQVADSKIPAKQLVLGGDGFPEEPPEEVCRARDSFLGAKRAAATAAETRGKREVALIETMQEHNIQRIRLDGENKFFEIEAIPHVKVKTMPKEQRQKKSDSEDQDDLEYARS